MEFKVALKVLRVGRKIGSEQSVQGNSFGIEPQGGIFVAGERNRTARFDKRLCEIGVHRKVCALVGDFNLRVDAANGLVVDLQLWNRRRGAELWVFERAASGGR